MTLPGDFMESKAVSNTGPLIHLYEIDLLKALDIFSIVIIPRAVEDELKRHRININSKIKIFDLGDKEKDNVMLLTNQYDLDLGEASAISLALQEKADYFLTDDLEARNVAKVYGIEVHGSVGIVLRAFRDKKLSKNEAIAKVREFKIKSSLFITEDIITHIIDSIVEFSGKN